MKPTVLRAMIVAEADRCKRFADDCDMRHDEIHACYWAGKEAGLMDALHMVNEFLVNPESEETRLQRNLRLSRENSRYGPDGRKKE